jgi:hypothetical protein
MHVLVVIAIAVSAGGVTWHFAGHDAAIRRNVLVSPPLPPANRNIVIKKAFVIKSQAWTIFKEQTSTSITESSLSQQAEDEIKPAMQRLKDFAYGNELERTSFQTVTRDGVEMIEMVIRPPSAKDRETYHQVLTREVANFIQPSFSKDCLTVDGERLGEDIFDVGKLYRIIFLQNGKGLRYWEYKTKGHLWIVGVFSRGFRWLKSGFFVCLALPVEGRLAF